eukprot:COSAG05_NODE_12_length_37297_cov_117.537072_27_plen_476_part_00
MEPEPEIGSTLAVIPREAVPIPFTNALGEPVEVVWYDNHGSQRPMYMLAKAGTDGARRTQAVDAGDGAWAARTGTSVRLLVSATTLAKRGHFVVGADASELWTVPDPRADARLLVDECVPKTFRINRNSVFKQYLLDKGWRAAEDGERAQLGHWDTNKVGPAFAEYDCWPRSSTNCIDNIWTYYKRVFDHGLADIFPQTFFDWRDASEATIARSPIWFLKDIWGCHGKGITLISSYAELQQAKKDFPKKASFLTGPSGGREEISDTCFLQRGLCNCHLFEGRKYILRVCYLTLGDGRTFVHGDALGYAHGVPFNPKDTSWHNHVSHHNVPGKISAPDERIYFTLSEQPWGREVNANIQAHSRKHSSIFVEVIAQSRNHQSLSNTIDNAKRYHLWGVDYLVLDDLSVTMIELNAFPNLNHNYARKGGVVNPNEMAYRQAGFDRDLMRTIGLPQEEKQDGPGWVDVTHPTAIGKYLS